MANWFAKPTTNQEATAPPGDATYETPPTESPIEEVAEAIPQIHDADPAVESVALVPTQELSEESNRSLALLSQAHRAIAEAGSVDEIKSIRDKAEAARKYAQVAGLGLEIQNYAAEVKLRAERRAGMMLAKLRLHGGDRREETSEERVTLDEIGVSKDQSSRWQLAAVVPEKTFARYVEETVREHGEVTTAGLVRIARDIRSKQKQREKPESNSATPKEYRISDSIADLVASGSKFACIYADPSWPSSAGAEAEVDGLGSFIHALSEQPIGELAEAHAHLHLWADDDSIFAAKTVMENWGFEFKGCLLCLNRQGRPGDYWIQAHEYLLLGVRGSLPLMERTLNSWMRACREPDGCPPERIRKLIERVSPGPYLELFGRRPATGWTTYSTFIELANDDLETSTDEGEEDAEAASA